MQIFHLEVCADTNWTYPDDGTIAPPAIADRLAAWPPGRDLKASCEAERAFIMPQGRRLFDGRAARRASSELASVQVPSGQVEKEA